MCIPAQTFNSYSLWSHHSESLISAPSILAMTQNLKKVFFGGIWITMRGLEMSDILANEIGAPRPTTCWVTMGYPL
jgi:hypothetical protein